MGEKMVNEVMGEDPVLSPQLKIEKPKKKNKKDKKRKRKNDGDEAIMDNNDDDAQAEKKETKSKTKNRKSTGEAETVNMDRTKSNASKDTDDETDDKEARRRERKKQREVRKKEKESLLEKVPKVDEDGIAYTKLQIKRMVKRVKQGLPPVPTEEEERERLRNEAQLRREEEAELAGMVYTRGQEEKESDEPIGNDDESIEESVAGGQNDGSRESPPDTSSELETSQAKQSPKKKAKRSKAVPPDYVCQACKNKHQPVHWIYDCPDKVTVRGTNQKKKKDRGLHDPDSRKVFLSGLPFDVKPSDVEQLFSECGKMTSCRLVKFGDTGRCNGQAYVSFETDAAANKALKLSGTTIDNTKEDEKKKKKKSQGTDSSKRKELKLKVSRVKNRRFTKSTRT